MGGAVGQRRWIGTMLLFSGLIVVGCASDDDGAGTEASADVVEDDGTTESAAVASTLTAAESSEAATTTPTTSVPTTAANSDFDCLDTATTTTSTTTTTGLPTVCQVIEDLPPGDIPPGELEYVVWSGTISGSIETTGCQAVSQSGEIVLVVFSNGDLSGAGETVAGAYTCDNGTSIPVTTNSYGIDGQMTDVFALTFDDGVQLSSGPIENGHAEIIQDTGAGVVTIELDCENC